MVAPTPNGMFSAPTGLPPGSRLPPQVQAPGKHPPHPDFNWPVVRNSPFIHGQVAYLPVGKVNYVWLGPPAAPVVVLIHGLNGSVASFGDFAPWLATAGFRVLAYDLLGFGLSTSRARCGGSLNLHTFVAQLAMLLDMLVGPVPVCLVGYSMGGLIAMEFARCYPRRVARMVLAATAGLVSQEEAPSQCLLFRCLRRGICWCSPLLACSIVCLCSPAVRRYMRDSDEFMPDVQNEEAFQAVSVANRERTLQNPSRTVRSYLSAVRNMPLWYQFFWDRLRGFADSKVPVLFLWGDQDGTVPLDQASPTLQRVFRDSGASCIVVPGGGHGFLQEFYAVAVRHAALWFSESNHPDWLAELRHWRLDGPGHAERTQPAAGVPAPFPCVGESPGPMNMPRVLDGPPQQFVMHGSVPLAPQQFGRGGVPMTPMQTVESGASMPLQFSEGVGPRPQPGAAHGDRWPRELASCPVERHQPGDGDRWPREAASCPVARHHG